MKINVRVKAGSKVEKIDVGEEGVTVFTHARAHDGEANEAIVKMVAKYYGVNKGSVRITKGAKSKNKVLEVG